MSFLKAVSNKLKFWGIKAEKAERESRDPELEMYEATQQARKQQEAVTASGTKVIAYQKMSEQKINDTMAEINRVEHIMKAALQQQQEALAQGDTTSASIRERVALSNAQKLAGLKSQLATQQATFEQASEAAEQARKNIAASESDLRESLNQIAQTKSDLDQAKSQEALNAAFAGMNDAFNVADTVNVAEVRDKVRMRLAASSAQSEVSGQSEHMQELDVSRAARESEAQDILAQARAEMSGSEAK